VSPLANVAKAIGGVVSGVYNKVINFRFIDPGDPRMGLSSTNQMDHVVWTDFIDQEKQCLKTEALEVEFKQLWPNSSAARVHRTSYEDFGEAPDDNPAKLVTKWLMFFPEGKPRVLKLRPKTRGGSECLSQ
jgi:hypothetical protein